MFAIKNEKNKATQVIVKVQSSEDDPQLANRSNRCGAGQYQLNRHKYDNYRHDVL
jgi:hypothetical protein